MGGRGERPAVTAPMFEFATAGHIVAGAGRAAELPGVVAGLGLPAAVFPVGGEPTAELARAGVAAAREHGADVVAAVGGGSVLDLGKAAAMLLGNGGDPLDYLEVVGAGRKVTRPSVPCVAVPAVVGTATRGTAGLVISLPAPTTSR